MLSSLEFGKINRTNNSILCAQAHNKGYYATSDNARRRSKPRRDQSCDISSESCNYLNCMHWHILYFMRLRRIYEFLCVHSNPILKGRNCRDYRPSHLKFREYFRPFWFSRSCVVVAYRNRRMCSSNVQGFVSTVLTVYEEENYAPLYRNGRMRNWIFTLHSSVS